MKYLLGLMLLPLLLTPAFAESVEDYEQIIPSENGTLNIGLLVDPPAKANEVSKLHIGWIKPGFNKIQEHIDYTVTVIKDGQNIFGPIPLTHTSIGTVKIPVEFTSNGEHQVKIEMEGILFQPIPLETTYFTINVGGEQTIQENNNEGGGCLIATAAFGSEMSPQVQQLREIRDNIVMQTSSGKSFMTGFNQIYYSFSPQIADYERENLIFKEVSQSDTNTNANIIFTFGSCTNRYRTRDVRLWYRSYSTKYWNVLCSTSHIIYSNQKET